MNNKEWRKWLFWFTFAVASIVVYKTIDSVSSIYSAIVGFVNLITPFLLATLLAYILYMPSKSVENTIKKIKPKFFQKHARGFSVFIVYVVAILLVFISFNFILPTVITSVTDLATNLPDYYNSRVEFFSNVDKDSFLGKLNIDSFAKRLKETNVAENIFEEIIQYINIDNITSYLKGIMSATSIIFDAFVTFVVSIYILLERKDIKSFLLNLSKAIFDDKTNKTIAEYYKRTNSIFFTYITSQILDAFIVGIITTIAMSLLGVKYAVLLGFIIGLLNIIPYFGAIVGVIIAIIITIFTGGLGQALWMALIVIVLQQIDANIINPKILGTSLNLSPILVIFAVTVGGTYFGVIGMFLGVPVIAFLKLILQDFISIKLKNKENNV